MQQGSQAVGEEAYAEDQDGGEGEARETDPVEEPGCRISHRETDRQAYDDLQHEHEAAGQHGGPAAVRHEPFRREDLDQDDGQGIGHRVVASRFQLQHRCQILPQVQFFAPEDGKDGRGIRGPHYRRKQHADEQGRIPGLPWHQPDEQAGQDDGQEHSEGREQRSLPEYGPSLFQGCFQACGEQDDGHREMTDGLRDFVIVEMQAQSVGADGHAQQQEEQQGRHAEARPQLGHQDGDKDEDRTQQEQVLGEEVDGEDGQREHQRISNRFRNPVIISTLRMSLQILATMTLPPFSAAALRRDRKMRRPELEM